MTYRTKLIIAREVSFLATLLGIGLGYHVLFETNDLFSLDGLSGCLLVVIGVIGMNMWRNCENAVAYIDTKAKLDKLR